MFYLIFVLIILSSYLFVFKISGLINAYNLYFVYIYIVYIYIIKSFLIAFKQMTLDECF